MGREYYEAVSWPPSSNLDAFTDVPTKGLFARVEAETTKADLRFPRSNECNPETRTRDGAGEVDGGHEGSAI